MSGKSRAKTKGAFGGLRGKRRKAQVRYMATRQGMMMKQIGGPIMNEPTHHVTERVEEAEPPQK